MTHRGLHRPSLSRDPDLASLLYEGAVSIWKTIASIERILRNDRPRGVISNITARPKGRGLTPRHELWAD